MQPVMSPRDLVIPALITRHAEDAAFYWSQIDGAVTAFLLTPDRLAHFDHLLEAHLEGLEVAGPQGLAPAFKALARWRKAGEAFVCTWLVGLHPDDAVLGQLGKQLTEAPDTLLRGAISALARLPQARAKPLLAHWCTLDARPVEQVVALRALALSAPGAIADHSLRVADFLASPIAPVRAAACRAMGRWQPAATDLLSVRLQDDDLAVRAEAAIALSGTPQPGQTNTVLWQCVAAQTKIYQESSGAYRQGAARRLHRWLRHLAWVTPFGHADLSTLFGFLPPRLGLTFALYHGDSAHLPRVVASMGDPETARYAGWVWQTLTGIDLRTSGLTLPEPEIDPDALPNESRRDADNGLPLPHVNAIGAGGLSLPTGIRLLLGQELNPARALQILEEQPQALRVIAGHALTKTLPKWTPQVQASSQEQAQQIATLRTTLAL